MKAAEYLGRWYANGGKVAQVEQENVVDEEVPVAIDPTDPNA